MDQSLKGPSLSQNGAMESASEAYPVIKGDALFKLLPDLEVE